MCLWFPWKGRKFYTSSMQGRPIVFVDVETTGSAAWNSRILEIGALRVEDGQVVGELNQVLDPAEPVPAWITQLTGIEPHETHGQPQFTDVASRVQHLFEGAVFVAHNVEFDYSFFTQEFRRLGQRFAMDKLCTVRLSRVLYPAERSHKLDEVIRRGGYQVSRRHRAYDDAEVLRRFYHDSLQQFGADYFYATVDRLMKPNHQLFM